MDEPPAHVLAPAKINLTLEVLGKQPNGRHALRSVAVPVALYDELVFERTGLPFEFDAGDPELQDGNIVVRALTALGAGDGWRITLRKHIPHSAGLGGGSSDAAAVLLAAMDGAFGAVRNSDWLSIAASLGSDVPFFLTQAAALIEGTGERVTALGSPPPWWAVVLRPALRVATGHAYELFDAAPSAASRARNTSASLVAGEALQRATFSEVTANCMNDFDEPLCRAYPLLARAKSRLRDAAATVAQLSGSGSCVFTLEEQESRARAVAAALAVEHDEELFVVPLHVGEAWAR